MTARLRGDTRRQVSYLLQMSAGHSQAAGFSQQFSESVVCWFNPQGPNPSDEREIRMMCRPHTPEHHSVSMTFTDVCVRVCVRGHSVEMSIFLSLAITEKLHLKSFETFFSIFYIKAIGYLNNYWLFGHQIGNIYIDRNKYYSSYS